jgi:CRP-like cAMP-binding protein
MLTQEDQIFTETSPLLAGAPEAVRSGLLEDAQVAAYANHEALFEHGGAADHVYLVLSGKVQLYRGPKPGKHAVLGVMQPGMAFAVGDVIAGERLSATAEAVGKTRVLMIPAIPFVAAVESDKTFALSLLKQLSRDLHQVTDQIECIQLKPTAQRLAEFLLRLTPKTNGPSEIILPFEKALIAAYLGMEPESLSRAFKDLRALGVMNRGRKTEIRDGGKLRSFCDAA